MDHFREYGQAPFDITVIHGGPGAPGEMAPVARELSVQHGVLEPLLIGLSVQAQVNELALAITDDGNQPMTMIGHSWGAMLAIIFAVKHPELVKKLILVGCPPLTDEFKGQTEATRLSRMTPEQKEQYKSLGKMSLHEIAALLSRIDAYDPIPATSEVIEFRHDVFESVWPEAAAMRSRGDFVEFAGQINLPVVAIHGDHDPHPAEGVRKPLESAAKDFKFILLEHCGHIPWLESEARDQFFGLLDKELA